MKQKLSTKSVAQMSRDELEATVAGQNDWIEGALLIFRKVRDMVSAADGVMLARGQEPSRFSRALLVAIEALENQVRK